MDMCGSARKAMAGVSDKLALRDPGTALAKILPMVPGTSPIALGLRTWSRTKVIRAVYPMACLRPSCSLRQRRRAVRRSRSSSNHRSSTSLVSRGFVNVAELDPWARIASELWCQGRSCRV